MDKHRGCLGLYGLHGTCSGWHWRDGRKKIAQQAEYQEHGHHLHNHTQEVVDTHWINDLKKHRENQHEAEEKRSHRKVLAQQNVFSWDRRQDVHTKAAAIETEMVSHDAERHKESEHEGA